MCENPNMRRKDAMTLHLAYRGEPGSRSATGVNCAYILLTPAILERLSPEMLFAGLRISCFFTVDSKWELIYFLRPLDTRTIQVFDPSSTLALSRYRLPWNRLRICKLQIPRTPGKYATA